MRDMIALSIRQPYAEQILRGKKNFEYRNHKLAVIEAKAWDKPLTEGVAQAKNYAEKLAIR
jgi:hypothetical protein